MPQKDFKFLTNTIKYSSIDSHKKCSFRVIILSHIYYIQSY